MVQEAHAAVAAMGQSHTIPWLESCSTWVVWVEYIGLVSLYIVQEAHAAVAAMGQSHTIP